VHFTIRESQEQVSHHGLHTSRQRTKSQIASTSAMPPKMNGRIGIPSMPMLCSVANNEPAATLDTCQKAASEPVMRQHISADDS
jgi:hypothetical protein